MENMKKMKLMLIMVVLMTQTTFAKTYVFVHGAMVDGTVWYKIIKPLEDAGHKVVVINLPAHGKDNTGIAEVNYQKYVAIIADSVNAQTGKVILVGHSMAGLLIASVAELLPDKIEKLVFVAAFIPQNGDNVFTLNGKDKLSQFGPNLMVANDKSSAVLNPKKIKDVFCPDCSDADISYLTLSQKSEPLAPLAESTVLTDKNYNSIPKYIIQTTQDHGISLSFQLEMAASAKNVAKTYKIESGHLPFITQPNVLIKILLNI
jgi:pimeloyl-ACP methyl ester carboxylesterase